MRAGVVGAGLAGCLAALSLYRAGHDVVVIERGARDAPGPAARHGHRFRAEDLAACSGLAGVAGFPDTAAPGRAGLLTVLRDAVAARCAVRWSAGVRSVARDAGGLSVTTQDGATIRADRWIDASGRALALASRAGATIDVDELRDDWAYRSWTVEPSCGDPAMVAHGSARIGYFIDGGRGIVTAMAPADAMPGAGTVSRALAKVRLPALSDPAPFRHAGSSLAVAAHPPGLPVLLTGDALVQSPPRHGDGLRHALATARIVAEERDLNAARAALDDYAADVWAGVALSMALERAGAEAMDA